MQDLGKPAVEELLLDWLAPFLNEAEKVRLIAWHLGVIMQQLYLVATALNLAPCSLGSGDS